ncbi:hypothetical protein TrST_g5242 [Triparma strigata]|uniref:Uncharacterized protein n=1 Tax=Triparma strigata TaxID=1606541 RepID=A0A9W6ZSW4_9STRA|nr:hypothetical protein TrST_g5242 [Triparma strigata]
MPRSTSYQSFVETPVKGDQNDPNWTPKDHPIFTDPRESNRVPLKMYQEKFEAHKKFFSENRAVLVNLSYIQSSPEAFLNSLCSHFNLQKTSSFFSPVLKHTKTSQTFTPTTSPPKEHHPMLTSYSSLTSEINSLTYKFNIPPPSPQIYDFDHLHSTSTFPSTLPSLSPSDITLFCKAKNESGRLEGKEVQEHLYYDYDEEFETKGGGREPPSFAQKDGFYPNHKELLKFVKKTMARSRIGLADRNFVYSEKASFFKFTKNMRVFPGHHRISSREMTGVVVHRCFVNLEHRTRYLPESDYKRMVERCLDGGRAEVWDEKVSKRWDGSGDSLPYLGGWERQKAIWDEAVANEEEEEEEGGTTKMTTTTTTTSVSK